MYELLGAVLEGGLLASPDSAPSPPSSLYSLELSTFSFLRTEFPFLSTEMPGKFIIADIIINIIVNVASVHQHYLVKRKKEEEEVEDVEKLWMEFHFQLRPNSCLRQIHTLDPPR